MLKRLLLPAILVPLLAGCGLVATFVPPLDIGDPLGVEGQQLSTTFGGATTLSAALSPQVVSTAEETITSSFDDVPVDMYGFSLKSFEAVIGLDAVVTLTAPTPLATFPDSFTLTRVAASATISDSVNGQATLAVERALDLVFVLDAGSCSAGSCDYLFAGSSGLDDALTITVPESERELLARFLAIIRLDGQPTPNRGSFRVTLEADSDPGLAGFGATFELHSEGTTIRLGG